ncbi:MAG: hypothetical protein KME20_28695 [Kaiparowitsia implicata GSE-PSE-MK54-09C]|jgi:hypothetical protein|nr:hypothetical protein [Kaiparowitsia implicata GSE-PSE-MK54-09C]
MTGTAATAIIDLGITIGIAGVVAGKFAGCTGTGGVGGSGVAIGSE